MQRDTNLVIIGQGDGEWEVLAAALREAGCSVDLASDAHEDSFHQKSYHLALIDASDPLIDGTEVLHVLKRMCPDTKAMVLGSGDCLQQSLNALLAGACTCLMRPFEIEEIVATVKQVLGMPKAPTASTSGTETVSFTALPSPGDSTLIEQLNREIAALNRLATAILSEKHQTQEELARRKEELLALHNMIKLIRESAGVRRVLEETVSHLARFIESSCIDVLLMNEDGTLGQRVNNFGGRFPLEIEPPSPAIMRQIMQGGRVFKFSQDEAAAAIDPVLTAAGIRSMGGWPIKVGGPVAGILLAYTNCESALEGAADLLAAFADVASVAIQKDFSRQRAEWLALKYEGLLRKANQKGDAGLEAQPRQKRILRLVPMKKPEEDREAPPDLRRAA